MAWLGYLAAAAGGLLLGIALFAVLMRRSRRAEPAPVEDPSPYAQVALERSDIGHVVLDAGGHVLYSNDRAVDLGVVRAGMVERRISAAAARAAVSHDPVDVELGVIDPPPSLLSGRRAPVAVLAEVRSIGDGLILVSASDQTEAMRLEAVRRDFVANVSHELKTPVAAIALLAEAVSDASDEPEAVRRFADRLVKESTRLGTLVGELIALSRLQGADPLPEFAVVETDAVIGEAASRAATVAENAGITIILGEPSGELVLGDRPMLVTALTNLIDNAVHYSPSGTSVSISSVVREDNIEIAVTDRGIGIAAENQDRVFERFFRIDRARSRATGGTGLGLAIVKHVAANHGGTALVWSRPGTGSTFTIRLPRYVSPVSSDPAAEPVDETDDETDDETGARVPGQHASATPSGQPPPAAAPVARTTSARRGAQ